MRYFLDTEFIEQGYGYPMNLVSVAIIAEDGREYYAQNYAAPFHLANSFVRNNVLSFLDEWENRHWSQRNQPPWYAPAEIATDIRAFVGTDPSPEFWGYYSDYDWVVLTQLFGGMDKHPKNWPYHCRDLRQWLDDHAMTHISQPEDDIHHALLDARWIRATCLELLMSIEEVA